MGIGTFQPPPESPSAQKGKAAFSQGVPQEDHIAAFWRPYKWMLGKQFLSKYTIL
jgi:hypothetical protein